MCTRNTFLKKEAHIEEYKKQTVKNTKEQGKKKDEKFTMEVSSLDILPNERKI